MDEDQLNNAKVEEQGNPALSKVIEQNIRTIIHFRTKAARECNLQSRIADAVTLQQCEYNTR